MAETRYDDKTREYLDNTGAPTAEASTRVKKIPSKDLPPTTAGIPNLLVREMPFLKNTNTNGFVLASNRLKDEMSNRALQPNIFVSPNQHDHTIAHETEHLLARQNAGFATEPRDRFVEMLGDKPSSRMARRDNFLKGLADSLPHLEEKYGIKNGYMNKDFIKQQGDVGLYEIFATLAGAESKLGVDLTKDPELRKTMFSDKRVREAYNAVTGLRQTRLDPRDLPPYTVQPETNNEPGIIDKAKKLMGFAEGGYIEHAGNKKLI
jgi:hypothetical protein